MYNDLLTCIYVYMYNLYNLHTANRSDKCLVPCQLTYKCKCSCHGCNYSQRAAYIYLKNYLKCSIQEWLVKVVSDKYCSMDSMISINHQGMERDWEREVWKPISILNHLWCWHEDDDDDDHQENAKQNKGRMWWWHDDVKDWRDLEAHFNFESLS